MPSRSEGFSLIEVLVAAFILFLVLATVTITYSGAVKSSLSASESLKLNNYVPMLSEHIALDIKNGETTGNSGLLDIQYEWTAELIESKPVVAFFDADNREVRQSDVVAYLWKVKLTTYYNNRQSQHTFEAVSWRRSQ